MKRRTATTGLLAMGIVIALATLGLVIGNWSQTLSINGSVSTAEIKVSISQKGSTDNAKTGANCSILIDSLTYHKKMSVRIINAFPGYYCSVDYSVTNEGKLPLSVSAGPTSSGDANVKVTDTCSGPAQLNAAGAADGSDRLDCKLTIDVNKGIGQGLSGIAIGQTIKVSAFNTP